MLSFLFYSSVLLVACNLSIPVSGFGLGLETGRSDVTGRPDVVCLWPVGAGRLPDDTGRFSDGVGAPLMFLLTPWEVFTEETAALFAGSLEAEIFFTFLSVCATVIFGTAFTK